MDENFKREEIIKEYISMVKNTDVFPDNIKNIMSENLNNSVKNILAVNINVRGLGFYNSSKKEVYIDTNKNKDAIKKVLIHELTHAASAVCGKDDEVTRVGFNDKIKHAGHGINEGVTEYYARKIFEENKIQADNKETYVDLVAIAKDIIAIYGNDVIVNSYIGGPEKLEQEMIKDGKSFTELREIMDDYYIAVYQDKRKSFDKMIKKPEVSGLYEKIGKFIEDIKKTKGMEQTPSEWKKEHKRLLDMKNIADYSIKEIYTNFSYFENRINNKEINIYSDYNGFRPKLMFVRGLKEYKKALNEIPYFPDNLDVMVNKILNSVESAQIGKNKRNAVEYNKYNNQIVFEEGYAEEALYSFMAVPFTEIAMKDSFEKNNPYRGIFYERMKYIEKQTKNIIDGVNKKNIGKTDYNSLIELFGEKTMLELNEANIEKIHELLDKANISDGFFEAFNTMYDSNSSYDEQEDAHDKIIKAIKKMKKYQKEHKKEEMIVEEKVNKEESNEQKLENIVNKNLSQDISVFSEPQQKLSWFQKLKNRIKNIFSKKEKTLLLNEPINVSKVNEDKRKSFEDRLKVTKLQIENVNYNKELEHKQGIEIENNEKSEDELER